VKSISLNVERLVDSLKKGTSPKTPSNGFSAPTFVTEGVQTQREVVDDICDYLGIRFSSEQEERGLVLSKIVTIVRSLSQCSLHTLRKIAEVYVPQLEKTSNKAYYVDHLGYRCAAALGYWNARMEQNWREFSRKAPEDILDAYSVGGYQKMAKKKKKKVAETSEKTVEKKRRGRGPTKGPTVTGFIREYFLKGGTREGCLDALEKNFPDRSREAMSKTLQVQLSYHLKKAYDVVVDGDKIKLKPKKGE